jgi:AcrR family transcriptional regulator
MSPPRAARKEPQATTRAYGGKTLDARRAEQRERILLAARDVFADRGYAGAGIEEIVSRAHASRTTFYVFFENKEECLLALFDFGLERLAAAVMETVAETADRRIEPIERIRAEVRAVAAALAADPAMARIVLIEIVGATPAAEHARARARNAAAKIIEVQLEQYPHWRDRAPLQRHVASLAAMAAIGEPISELVAAGRIDQWETLIDPISEFVAHGLISPKASWPESSPRGQV